MNRARFLPVSSLASRLRFVMGAGGGWFLLVTPRDASLTAVGAEIIDECEAQLPDAPARTLRVADDVDAFATACASGSTEVVVALAEAVSDHDWKRVDVARSALLKVGAGVLVLPERDLDAFLSGAPNFASVMGAETFFWAPDPSTLDDDACEALLTSFRDRSGLTDDALIAAASAGTAPDEPYVAQWLVLLGREDLLRG